MSRYPGLSHVCCPIRTSILLCTRTKWSEPQNSDKGSFHSGRKARPGPCKLVHRVKQNCSGLSGTQELGLWEIGHLGCEHRRGDAVPSALWTEPPRSSDCLQPIASDVKLLGLCWAVYAGHAAAPRHSRCPGCLSGRQESCRIHALHCQPVTARTCVNAASSVAVRMGPISAQVKPMMLCLYGARTESPALGQGLSRAPGTLEVPADSGPSGCPPLRSSTVHA